ncbi:non-specific lipid-transfer protein 1 [Neltuma alba]|uniref:Non-specific lipid-transfer protein n=1 Tax=Neltuma juliflora TaxID=3128859 RepID=Q1KL62_NELJU|nr:non-specific lipid-transfer protein 1-like [Prosopis alba]XP_028808592.1 non-specific lipid-transfer protein 1-like [Prosopis alba]ABF06565.1 non-specific lipid transfer-like protein [Prosopis juliflora]
MAGLMKVAFMAVLCVALVVAPMAEAVTCGQVSSSLAPCIAYLQKGGTPAPGCCNGVKSLVGAAQTTADKQAVCNCLKGAAGQVPGLNNQYAQSLPSLCGVNIPYKISTSTNCASIKF